MTGYVTVVLAWGFFTRDVKDVPAALIPTKVLIVLLGRQWRILL